MRATSPSGQPADPALSAAEGGPALPPFRPGAMLDIVFEVNPGMDFDQLEIFLEVARLSSFSRAAEKRFRTQPAISSQIRALEEEVGARLLDRSGGRVSLTVAGKLFFKYAEETLEQRKTIFTAIA